MNDLEIRECVKSAWTIGRKIGLCANKMPRVKIRRSRIKAGSSGRAYPRAHRIVLTIGTKALRGDSVELVLHELAHLTEGGHDHGAGFKRNFNWLFSAWFGLPPLQFSGPIWQQSQQAHELARAMYGENG